MKRITSASLDITYKCNLRCRHCYNHSGESIRKELSTAEVVELADQFSELELDSVCICGGEPTMRLGDVIAFAATLSSEAPGTAVNMVTNGLLWNEAVSKKLLDAGVRGVQFSLDGFSDASYDYVRGSEGGLSKVKNTIRAAVAAGFNVMVSALPHSKNLNEFEQIIDFCSEAGVSELRVQPLMPLGRGEENYDRLRISDEQQASLSKILQRANNIHQKMTITWGDPLDHFFAFEELGYIPQIAINAQGEVLVSPYLPFSIWRPLERPLSEYIRLGISSSALKHPLVREAIGRFFDVSDLTSHLPNLPELFIEGTYDLMDELLKRGGSDGLSG